jgi:hypothetical protein
MKFLTNIFKKKEVLFIPTWVGLIFLDDKKDAVSEVCRRYFGADGVENLTSKEKEVLRKIIEGVKEAIHNPPPPKVSKSHSLTFKALFAFEDYNDTIHQAPYLLASIIFHTDEARDAEANKIYNEWDFRDFFSQYIFFLTWRKNQLKRSHLTVRSVLRFYTIKRTIMRFLRLFLRR